MEEKKNQKGLVWLIVILIILVLGLIGFVVYNKVLSTDKTNKEDSKTTLITTTSKNNKTKVIEKDFKINFNDLVELLKDYYVNQEKQEGISDFYDDDNVEKWNIDSIKYLGYYENDENIKYYVANGNFKCKDNGYTCIYMEQVDYETTENIPFKSIFAIKQTNNKYQLDHMESLIFDDMVKGDGVSSKGFVLIEKNIKEIEKQFASKIFSNYPKENDETVIIKGFLDDLIKEKGFELDHKEVYVNKKVKFGDTGIEFIYNSKNCDNEEEQDSNGNVIDNYNWCEDIEISINNEHILTIYSGRAYESVPYVLVTKDYIISQVVGQSGIGSVDIFNMDGKKVGESKNSTSIYGSLLDWYNDESSHDDDGYDEKFITLNNDKLYYVSHKDICYSQTDEKNASINYIDLKTMKEYTTVEFKANVSEQC